MYNRPLDLSKRIHSIIRVITMTASILDGRKVADERLKALQKKVDARKKAGLPPPALAVILLGKDPASKIYVNHKHKACESIGFTSFVHHLPAETDEKTLTKLIDSLNENTEIDGILVQLPLPEHIHSRTIIERVHPLKDVDGFHPYNLGRLAQGNPTFRPCTPHGIIHLLAYYNIDPHGLNTVVIGKSNIVGRPMALELLLKKATVTLCHRATKNLAQHIKNAELVVIAAGSKDIIPPDCFHQGQIVVDVGIHREPDGTIRGDVNFQEVKQKVAWITPVPGGIGPMTIVSLLENTLRAAEYKA